MLTTSEESLLAFLKGVQDYELPNVTVTLEDKNFEDPHVNCFIQPFRDYFWKTYKVYLLDEMSFYPLDWQGHFYLKFDGMRKGSVRADWKLNNDYKKPMARYLVTGKLLPEDNRTYTIRFNGIYLP